VPFPQIVYFRLFGKLCQGFEVINSRMPTSFFGTCWTASTLNSCNFSLVPNPIKPGWMNSDLPEQFLTARAWSLPYLVGHFSLTSPALHVRHHRRSMPPFLTSPLTYLRHTLALCESPRTMKNNQTATSTIACRNLLRGRSWRTLSDSTATAASRNSQAPNSSESGAFQRFFASI